MYSTASSRNIEPLEARIAPATLAILSNDAATAAPQDLLLINSSEPDAIRLVVPIPSSEFQDQTGMEVLVGIDTRPSNGLLYGLSNSGFFYSIELNLSGPTTVTAHLTRFLGMGATAPTLNGTHFGVDFNPAADRFRVVSDAEQNFRINPNDGGQVDSDPMTMGIQEDAPLSRGRYRPDCIYE